MIGAPRRSSESGAATTVPSSLEGLPQRSVPTCRQRRLEGRVALVTGAAGGLGEHIAPDFVAEGCAVVVADLDAERVQRTASRLRRECPEGRVLGVPLDVTSSRDWQRALRRGRRSLGPVDLLVNSAGVVGLAGVDRVTESEWHTIVDVNQTAIWRGIQACLPTMWAAGGGSIVTIGSIFGSVGSGASFSYHATKGAVQAMTVAAAVELAPRRIRVNAVLPGLIDTPLTRGLGADMFRRFEGATPLARLASPEDVASATTFLASEAAGFITGACLTVDGGYTAA